MLSTLRAMPAQVRGVAFHPAEPVARLQRRGRGRQDLGPGRRPRSAGNSSVTPVCVRCVAFSQRWEAALLGLRDNTAKVWDVATGQEVLTLRGHSRLGLGRRHQPGQSGGSPRPPRTHGEGLGRQALDPGCGGGTGGARACRLPVRQAPAARPMWSRTSRDSAVLRPRAREIALRLVDRYHEEPDLGTLPPGELGPRPPALPQRLPVPLRPAPGGARLPPGPRSARSIASASARLSTAPADTGRRSRPWGQPIGSTGFPGVAGLPGHGPSPARAGGAGPEGLRSHA